jgi:hypothetical protein
MTKLAILFVPVFLITLSTGCSSLPTTSGSWIGTVSGKTFYDHGSNGSKECQVASIHVVNGTTLNPSLGYDLWLVDQNDCAIDASSFPPGSYVKVSGEAGLAEVNDEKRGIINSVKDSSEAYEPVVRVTELTDASTEKTIKIKIAVARIPSTQPSPEKMP